MLSDRRLAMVLRMFVSGTSVPGAMDGTGAAGRAAGVGADPPPGAEAGRAVGADHDSMSRLMIRPPGPLPETDDRSMSFLAAMLRASGLAFTRPPSLREESDSAGAGAGAEPAFEGGAAAGGACADDATDADW